MKKSKNLLIIISVVAGLVAASAGAYYFISKSSTGSGTDNTAQTSKLTGEELRKKAIAASNAKNFTEAVDLWTQARDKFKAEGNVNGEQDAKAQIVINTQFAKQFGTK